MAPDHGFRAVFEYRRFMPRWPGWTGLSERRWPKDPDEEFRPAKTAWDWLQLLVVPLALAGLALAFNTCQAARDASREEDRANLERDIAKEARLDDALRAYLAQISDLILERSLLSSREGSEVQAVARTLTLAAARHLDGRRKGELVRYLADSRLIEGPPNPSALNAPTPKIRLYSADLRHADLRRSFLFRVNLGGADLSDASFDKAELLSVSFGAAHMDRTTFRDTRMAAVDFSFGKLREAVFDRTYIEREPPDPLLTFKFPKARFEDTCLSGARFRDARLPGVTFRRAAGTDVDLTGASLMGGALSHAVFEHSKLGGAEITGGLPNGWTESGRSQPHPEVIKDVCSRDTLPTIFG